MALTINFGTIAGRMAMQALIRRSVMATFSRDDFLHRAMGSEKCGNS